VVAIGSALFIVQYLIAPDAPSTETTSLKVLVTEPIKDVAPSAPPRATDESKVVAALSRQRRRAQDAVTAAYNLRPISDAGLVIDPVGECDLPFVREPKMLANFPAGRKSYTGAIASTSGRQRVAVSLMVLARDDWLQESVSSLLASDLMGFADIAIFAYYNMNGTGASNFMRNLKAVPVIEVPNPEGTNQGIVVPRIRLMEGMMAHGCNFQWFLEIHDDMYFYPNWFMQLLAHDQPHYGILMPFIMNGSKSGCNMRRVRIPLSTPRLPASCAVATLQTFDEVLPLVTKDLVEGVNVTYERCIQVHPWLIKREFIEDVGYYDPIFAPHIGEDDDLYMRMLRAGWVPAAIRVCVTN
jgi:hypothetical protein